MLRFYFSIVLYTLVLLNPAKGQQVIFREDFSNLPQDLAIAGVDGTGINLSQSAKHRKALKYNIDPATWKGSFTVLAWVKGVEDFETFTMLDLGLVYADSSKINWRFNKQENHSWAWELRKGQNTLDYKPGSVRQSITSDWTLLTMSFDAEKQEVLLYFNTKQVAIYSLEGLVVEKEPVSISLQLAGEEKGDTGEWELFNGFMDQVQVFDGSLTGQQIKGMYEEYRPSEKMTTDSKTVDTLRVMTFNIWHGGNETGKSIGPQRIVELIQEANADIVTMQETYGSGAYISDALGYYFYLRGDNISIMSRYPIIETLASYKAFHNGNVLIDCAGHKIRIASVWLNYPLDYWLEIDMGRKIDVNRWVALQDGNRKTMEGIIQSLDSTKPEYADLPIILGGDFNSGSHLDWVESVKDKNAGYVMPFPTGKYLESIGFKDTFRDVHPDPKKNRGITWSPINPKTHQDRIDFIFRKGNLLRTIDSRVINSHPIRYPSDHAAVLSTFKLLNQE